MASIYAFLIETLTERRCKRCDFVEFDENTRQLGIDEITSKKFSRMHDLCNPDHAFETTANVVSVRKSSMNGHHYQHVTVVAEIDGHRKQLNCLCFDPEAQVEIGSSVAITVCTYRESHIDIDFVCEECFKKNIVYVEDLKPYDRAFDLMVWSHGVNAFNRAKSSNEIRSRILSVSMFEDIEICCSHKTQRIGDVGVFVKGEVVCVSNIDLWSKIDQRSGKRFVLKDCYRNSGIIRHFSQYSTDKWSHTEVVVKPRKVCGIWAKENFLNNFYNAMMLDEVARKLGVKVIKVK